MSYYPMERPENFQDNLEFFHTKLYPDNCAIPRFFVYDRACQLSRAFKPGNVLADYAYRWNLEGIVRWIVDRFHFFGHKSTDEHCRHADPNLPAIHALPSHLIELAKSAHDLQD